MSEGTSVQPGELRWIFGYGSLVWRPDFSFRERQVACVSGWVRRFWQGSTDHRGLPGAPGRVVTLVPAAGALCWGRAYAVHWREEPEVFERLDQRERGGYRRVEVELGLFGERVPEEGRDDGASPAQGVVYIATQENPNYLGEASLEEIAAQVIRARGPSGENLEYVLELFAALRSMGATDPHVEALAAELERLRG